MRAPIALFVYNRLKHTRLTIEALQCNQFAEESDLFVFCDGSKTQGNEVLVKNVRDYLRTVSGFRKITITERDSNLGLARSVITGVTEVVERYGKVIVLEDDLVTSPYFLRYMNDALNRFSEDRRVWHISGWNYPIDPAGLPEAFFWRGMNCWGWATWADRWRHFRRDPESLVATWNREKIRRFNIDGTHDFWRQVLDNHSGSRSTWAVFWYATIFENDGLCLNPARSLVQNIGHDGTGENCDQQSARGGYVAAEAPVDLGQLIVDEDAKSLEAIKRYGQRRMSLRFFLRKISSLLRNIT